MAMRHALSDKPESEVRAMLGGNAAQLYGFDLEKLQALGGSARAEAVRDRRPARTRRVSEGNPHGRLHVGSLTHGLP